MFAVVDTKGVTLDTFTNKFIDKHKFLQIKLNVFNQLYKSINSAPLVNNVEYSWWFNLLPD